MDVWLNEPIRTDQAQAAGCSVSELVELLSPSIVTGLSHMQRDIVLSGPTIYDPTEPLTAKRGDLVLAVGLADEMATRQVIMRAAELGAAAVAMKVDDELARSAIEVADKAGITLLAVPREMPWADFHLLATAAITAPPASDELDVPLGDLFALANAIATLVQGAVTIHDPQSRLLAYSSGEEPVDEVRRLTILERRGPEEWLSWLRKEGFYRSLRQSREPVRVEFPDRDLRPRLAIAVRSGDSILGHIWVTEGNVPLTADAEQVLIGAAEIACRHILEHQVTTAVDKRIGGALLRSALERSDRADLLARTFGLDIDTPSIVVVYGLEGDESARPSPVAMRRLLDAIALYWQTYRQEAFTALIRDRVFCLLPVRDTSAVERLKARVEDTIAHQPLAVRNLLRAGIGAVVPTLGELPRSRSDAEHVLRVLARRPSLGTVAAISDVVEHVLLMEVEEAVGSLPHFTLGKLEHLFAADRESKRHYIETLRAYFDAGGDIVAAAQALHLHPNSLRYRLRRLVAISGIALEDPDERFLTELLLRISVRGSA